MASVKEIVGQMKADHGDSVIRTADTIIEVPRIPTGIFALDLALGGGIPRGRVSEMFGMESSCKSNIALKLVANHQKMFPDLECAYLDIEHGFDGKWAQKFGVDVKKLHLIQPDFGEQAIDLIEGFLAADDCGFVVLDSLAALMTSRAKEKSAESSDPGGQGMLGKKMFDKIVDVQRMAEKKKETGPTFFYINQIRHKIGVMFGSPETTPGGFSPKFYANLRMRSYAKDVKEDKAGPLAVRKEVHIEIKKHKVPIAARECVFEMAMIPHKTLKVGEVDDWKTLSVYLQKHNYVIQDQKTKKWTFDGTVYDTAKSVREAIVGQPVEAKLRKSIIAKEVNLVYNDMVVLDEDGDTDAD